MDLFSLKPGNLADLPTNELIKVIVARRNSRRVNKREGSAPKGKKHAPKATSLNMDSVMGLSADDLERLINTLEGNNDETGGSET